MPGPGPGRDLNFLLPGLGRGWAGIKNFEITGAGTGKIENAEAGPGSEFFLLPGPGFFLLPGPRPGRD